MESLIDLDQSIFIFFNQQLRNSLFDLIMPYLREKNFWIPLYVVLLFYFILYFKVKSWIAIAFAAATAVITDQSSSSLIKPLVHRIRPCNDPSFSAEVHLLVSCGGGFSFISAHAANHFGLACFLIVMLRERFKWIVPAALAWATLVAFAQVYVGLHYPFDVLCGGIFGSIVGTLTGKICKSLLSKKRVERLY
ncbi:MAG: phosphatase PAP2 family protein [Chitinophagales bacterium]|nr:phosphatase PAP2 family protein [Chitinophagales bacterium]